MAVQDSPGRGKRDGRRLQMRYGKFSFFSYRYTVVNSYYAAYL